MTELLTKEFSKLEAMGERFFELYNCRDAFRVYSTFYFCMLTKRTILLIIGIVVAIAVCLSTSLFGMEM